MTAMAVQLDRVDLGPTPDGPDGSRIPPAPTVIGILAVLALVVAALVLRTDDDIEVAVEETTTTDPAATTVPGEGSGPAPLALGAPDDGMDSVGLPVSAEPATDLVDGQLVTVSGSGFPAGEAVGVVMCTREAARDHGGRGVEACNLGNFAQADADSQGVAVVEFAVRRMMTLDGQEVDCASERGRCIIGMGLLSDYDQSGGFALHFDADAPAPPPPSMELAKTSDIADGETVDAVVTGLVPGGHVAVQQCEVLEPDRCVDLGAVVAGDDGVHRGGIRLWRTFGAHHQPGGMPPNVDCAVSRCQLQLLGETVGGRTLAPVELGFDPASGARVAPVAELVRPGPFGPTETVEIRLTGTDEGTWIDANMCLDTGECFGFGQSSVWPGGSAIEVDLRQLRGHAGCECAITFAGYRGGDGVTLSGPPPLFPDPITITITD